MSREYGPWHTFEQRRAQFLRGTVLPALIYPLVIVAMAGIGALVLVQRVAIDGGAVARTLYGDVLVSGAVLVLPVSIAAERHARSQRRYTWMTLAAHIHTALRAGQSVDAAVATWTGDRAIRTAILSQRDTGVAVPETFVRAGAPATLTRCMERAGSAVRLRDELAHLVSDYIETELQQIDQLRAALPGLLTTIAGVPVIWLVIRVVQPLLRAMVTPQW